MLNLLFPNRYEKFLILEITKKGTSGFLFYLSQEKILTLKKVWDKFSWKKISRKWRGCFEKWKVIVATDPALSTTFVFPVKFEREKGSAKSPLSAVELENLLAQATAKAFPQYRSEASKKLGINELDTILIDNRVSQFKIDGHRVLNPLDFPVRKIETTMELTLTTRAIFNDWKNSFNTGEERDFFFTEISKSQLFALKRVVAPPFSLVSLEESSPSYILNFEKLKTGEVINRYEIEWSWLPILETIQSSFALSPQAAARIYSLYLNEEISPRAERHLNKILKPVISPLLKQIARNRLKGKIYFDTNFPLHAFMPQKISSASIAELPLEAVLDKTGFRTDFSGWEFTPDRIFRYFSPFLEFYYNNEDLSINHWLRRRLHWLGR